MKSLFIPPLGTALVLAADWTFDLFAEYRNDGTWRPLKLDKPTDARGMYNERLSKPVTLPAGIELTVRRYYIRQGNAPYDSVTFSVKIGNRSNRFWAKLVDVNRLQLIDEVANG